MAEVFQKYINWKIKASFQEGVHVYGVFPYANTKWFELKSISKSRVDIEELFKEEDIRRYNAMQEQGLIQESVDYVIWFMINTIRLDKEDDAVMERYIWNGYKHAVREMLRYQDDNYHILDIQYNGNVTPFTGKILMQMFLKNAAGGFKEHDYNTYAAIRMFDARVKDKVIVCRSEEERKAAIQKLGKLNAMITQSKLQRDEREKENCLLQGSYEERNHEILYCGPERKLESAEHINEETNPVSAYAKEWIDNYNELLGKLTMENGPEHTLTGFGKKEEALPYTLLTEEQKKERDKKWEADEARIKEEGELHSEKKFVFFGRKK